jgi:hypothetical protein
MSIRNLVGGRRISERGRDLGIDYPCPFLYTRPHIGENTRPTVGGACVHHF